MFYSEKICNFKGQSLLSCSRNHCTVVDFPEITALLFPVYNSGFE
jgi:hypothetical protein